MPPEQGDNGNTGGTPGEGEGGTSEPTIQDVLGMLGALKDSVEGLAGSHKKLTGDVIGLRKKLQPEDKPGDKPSGDKPTTAAPPTVDPFALLDLGAKLAALPNKARDSLKELVGEGASPAEIQRAMAFVQLGLGSVETTDPKNGETPKRNGFAATAAPSSAKASWPATQAEYMEIVKTDKKRAAALRSDPDFDPYKLKAY